MSGFWPRTGHSGCCQSSSENMLTLARTAATRMTGMFDAYISRLEVERSREDLLRDPACDKERNARADAPLRHDLVHQEHEVGAAEELRDDEELGPRLPMARRKHTEEARPVQARHERRGGGQESVDLRDRLDEDHHDHEEFLGPLVDALVFVVLQIEVDDLRPGEELHDDRGGDDRADAEMHQRPLGAREDGPEAREEVDDVRPIEAIDEDVRHREVDDEDREDPEHLRSELDMSFRTCDRGKAVRQRLEPIEPTLLLLFEGHRSRPEWRGEDDLTARAGDLGDRGLRRFRDGDAHRERYATRP